MKRTYLIIIVTVISYICTRLFFFDNTTPVSKELTLKNVSVVIDPGHGGLDNGASVGNIYESDLNLKISFALKEELENRGAKVYMTRTDDQDMTKRNHHYSKQDDMYLRVKKIDEYECDYLISIHLQGNPFGAGPDPPAHFIIPQLHFRAGRRVGTLGKNEELFVKGVFIEPGSGG